MTDEEEITAVHYRLQVETLSVFSSALVSSAAVSSIESLWFRT